VSLAAHSGFNHFIYVVSSFWRALIKYSREGGTRTSILVMSSSVID
jgi:hypothetical protein